MLRALRWSIVVACIAANPAVAQVAPGTAPLLQPAAGKHYADPDRMIDRLDRARIEYFAGELAKVCGVEVMVAVAPSLGGRKARVVADELANAWGVGKRHGGQGIFILLAPKDGDSQLRVTESLNYFVIDDADAQATLERAGVPHWKQRRWGEGIVSVIREVDGRLRTLMKKPAAIEPTQAQLDALEPAPATGAGSGDGRGNGLAYLLAAAGVLGGAAVFFMKRAATKARTCQKCGVEMTPLAGADLSAALDPRQQKEHAAGGVRFEVRKCPTCGDRRIVSESVDPHFDRCPHCNLRTGRKTITVLAQPTDRLVGQRRIDVVCAPCQKPSFRLEEIPKLAAGTRAGYTGDDKARGDGFQGGGGGAKF